MTEKEANADVSWIEPVLEDTFDGASALLVLPDEITHAQAAGCLHMLLTVVRAENRDPITFVIDAASLAHFDSSALAVLLGCRRAVLQTGRRFAVRSVPVRLAELAHLYGVEEVLGINTST